MKNRFIIKIWETEKDRKEGTPFELLNTHICKSKGKTRRGGNIIYE